MPDKDKNEEVARLKQLSEDLSGSLKRCRAMLQDYQAKFAANSNKAEIPDEGLGGSGHGPD
jgi:hypothetical protein